MALDLRSLHVEFVPVPNGDSVTGDDECARLIPFCKQQAEVIRKTHGRRIGHSVDIEGELDAVKTDSTHVCTRGIVVRRWRLRIAWAPVSIGWGVCSLLRTDGRLDNLRACTIGRDADRVMA
jgi:hypothetical protein